MRCAAFGCTYDTRQRDVKKPLFNFPKDKVMKEKWLAAMSCYVIVGQEIAPYKSGNNSALCSDHFEEDCFCYIPSALALMERSFRKRLKPEAVPTIFPEIQEAKDELIASLKDSRSSDNWASYFAAAEFTLSSDIPVYHLRNCKWLCKHKYPKHHSKLVMIRESEFPKRCKKIFRSKWKIMSAVGCLGQGIQKSVLASCNMMKKMTAVSVRREQHGADENSNSSKKQNKSANKRKDKKQKHHRPDTKDQHVPLFLESTSHTSTLNSRPKNNGTSPLSSWRGHHPNLERNCVKTEGGGIQCIRCLSEFCNFVEFEGHRDKCCMLNIAYQTPAFPSGSDVDMGIKREIETETAAVEKEPNHASVSNVIDKRETLVSDNLFGSVVKMAIVPVMKVNLNMYPVWGVIMQGTLLNHANDVKQESEGILETVAGSKTMLVHPTPLTSCEQNVELQHKEDIERNVTEEAVIQQQLVRDHCACKDIAQSIKKEILADEFETGESQLGLDKKMDCDTECSQAKGCITHKENFPTVSTQHGVHQQSNRCIAYGEVIASDGVADVGGKENDEVNLEELGIKIEVNDDMLDDTDEVLE